MSVLDRLKIRLNIVDDSADAEINNLISIIENKLKLKYNWQTIPEKYVYLIEIIVYALLRVKNKLGLEYSDDTKNDLILQSYDDAMDFMLTYCNLEYLQEGMEYILTDFTYLIATNPHISSTGSIIITPTGNVKSIKEGDTQVTYADKKTSTSTKYAIPKVTAYDFLEDMSHRLQKYRVVNW